jgi:AcrR family transcriptional regulator
VLDEEKTKRRGRPRSDARREELILAAFTLLAEQGFDGLRVRDVAAHVGVNVATLHYYFPEKSDLVRGVLQHAAERFRATGAALREDFALAELLQEFADSEQQLDKEPHLFRALFELQLHAQRDPALQRELGAMESDWLAHLTGLFQAAFARGTLALAAGTDASALALEMMALIKGAAMQRCCGYQTAPLTQTGRRFLTALLKK